MKKVKPFNNIFVIFLIGGFAISFFFLLYVYTKSAPDFPVILRSNDLGYNFLTQRLKIWFLPLLILLFISLNKALITLTDKQDERLISILDFVNLELVILLVILSLQIFILNL